MITVYLVIGVPSAGKSWVCYQLKSDYQYVLHDDYMEGGYVEAILSAAKESERPILAEAPFSINEIKEPLEDAGCEVIPVFILEDEEILSHRYREREGKEIPKGHLTRQRTYAQRAVEFGAFSGTSDEVLEYLRQECESQVKQRSK